MHVVSGEATLTQRRRWRQKLRRIFKPTLLVLLMLAFLGLRSDVLRLNLAQRVALPYEYSLLTWEASNLLSKWTHRLASLLPWDGRPTAESERLDQVVQYFRLGDEINALNGELRRTAAQAPEAAAGPLLTLEAELAELKGQRDRLRNDVEETLEASISAVLVEEDLATWGALIFPPVDIRLSDPARLLVTSPRDRIERAHEALLDPDVDIPQSEGMERELQESWDLSALVVSIGGLATYPASVNNRLHLRDTLRTGAHEWLHNYLTVRLTPLGRNIYSGPEMLSLNETLADIAGDEIGDRAFLRLGGTPDPPPPRSDDPRPTTTTQEIEDEKRFDFAMEMRETRRRVDELLAGGSAEEAEAYMEERRRLFVANGVHIRKLNQAYFAFYGTYAESPTSVSPIADQLHAFRALTQDLKTFVTTVARFSTYQEFLDELERLKNE